MHNSILETRIKVYEDRKVKFCFVHNALTNDSHAHTMMIVDVAPLISLPLVCELHYFCYFWKIAAERSGWQPMSVLRSAIVINGKFNVAIYDAYNDNDHSTWNHLIQKAVSLPPCIPAIFHLAMWKKGSGKPWNPFFLDNNRGTLILHKPIKSLYFCMSRRP